MSRVERFNARALALRLQPPDGSPAAPSTAHRLELLQGSTGTMTERLEERRDRQGLTDHTDLGSWGQRAFVEGYMELAPPPNPGSETQGAPHAHPVLEIGGLRQSLYGGEITRYNPLTDGIALSTADFWQAGTLRRLTDARAKISELRIEIGQRPRLRARIEGLCGDVDEAEVPEALPPPASAPIATAASARARVIVGDRPALAVWAKSLDIDLRAALRLKDFTSRREHAYAGRDPVYTLTLARPSLADFDPWAARKAGQRLITRLRVETGDGRAVEIGARGLIRDIVEIDLDGDYGLQISGPCIATRPGGNEVWLAFGPAAVMAAGYYDDIEAEGGPDELRAAGNLLHQVMNVDYPMTLGAA